MLESITGFVTTAVSSEVGFGWIIFFIILILIVLYSFRHIMDIAVDLWRIPFAVILDAIDIMAYSSPYLDVVASAGNLVLFWVFCRRGHHLGKVFAVVAAAEALIGIWIFPDYAFVTNLLPTSTILMFVSVWSH